MFSSRRRRRKLAGGCYVNWSEVGNRLVILVIWQTVWVPPNPKSDGIDYLVGGVSGVSTQHEASAFLIELHTRLKPAEVQLGGLDLNSADAVVETFGHRVLVRVVAALSAALSAFQRQLLRVFHADPH